MKLDEVLRIFRIFSDRTRLRIFLLFLDAELCVGELMAILQLEQSLISHQLGIMRQAGLIEARRNGRWVFYRISPGRRKQLEPLFRDWLKEELAVSGHKVRTVKEKKVCQRLQARAGQLKKVTSGKARAGNAIKAGEPR